MWHKTITCARANGTPYFQNFINSDLNPGDVRSMCCRLRLDKRELRKRGGGLFGSDEFTGSLGVVTINLPQIGYLAKDEEQFFVRLDYLMDLAKESLCIKRKVIQKLLDNGLFPYTKRYLKKLESKKAEKSTDVSPLNLTETHRYLNISCGETEYILDKPYGRINSIKKNGTELLEKP